MKMNKAQMLLMSTEN